MDKNVVIVLGAGKSGIYATKLLLTINVNVILYDENELIDKNNIKKYLPDDSFYTLRIGDIPDIELNEAKMCVISPGFPNHKEIIKKIRERNIPIISEVELAYLRCNGNICAITGSNGKTTTSLLIGEILKKQYNDVHICGNSGEPFSKEVLTTTIDSATVVELSSFQLEHINTFRPNVAAILNISPENLDRYNNYAEYIKIELNIAVNQNKSDYLILNYEDDVLRELALNNNIFKSRIVFFSSKRVLPQGFYYKDNAIYYKENVKSLKLVDVENLKLLGIHNYENVMAAIAVAYYMGVPFSVIIEECKNFMPIEHRVEFVRERSGVKFYNDAKSNNPNAAIKAMDAMNGKVILIAGGKYNGVDYGDFVAKAKEKVKNMILIGESKKAIASKCRSMNYSNISYANDLEEAIDIANSYANVGDNILFSPACQVENNQETFEERGIVFKNKVKNLR